ncbi:hypothetical protein [Kiloniella majae]|uniref:hypothetical protein n=1 Tax=Kiloniella majae TaxID=1938558 RepID=UPI000F7B6DEB|nr:hypothetical protein [Kiloniella majae]
MKQSIRPTWFCALKHHFRLAIKAVLVSGVISGAGLTAPMVAEANVTSVTVTPQRANVNVKGASALSLTWNVTRFEPTAPTTVPVSSTNAVLQINGSTVANLGGTLLKQSSLAAAQSETLRFSEVLSISPALARKIAEAPTGSVLISRTFTDTQTTGLARLSVFAGTGQGGALSINRIDLRFDNDARTDVIAQGDTRRAIAEINFRSSGLLKGEWRIIDPTASLGSARGRILQVVRQQVVSSGQGRTRIVSPALPTAKNGLYLLTFSVENADGIAELPVLRYFVLEGTTNRPEDNLTTLSPGNGVRVSQDTVFAWENVPGALAYQVEIFNPGHSKVVSGKVVSAKDLKLKLSAFSLDNLTSGESYDWRLRAFDKEGRVIGSSPRQLIFMP